MSSSRKVETVTFCHCAQKSELTVVPLVSFYCPILELSDLSVQRFFLLLLFLLFWPVILLGGKTSSSLQEVLVHYSWGCLLGNRLRPPWRQRSWVVCQASSNWSSNHIASLGYRASILWRSLLERHNLLSLGLGHCISNNLSTCIWLDKWNSSFNGFSPSTFFLDRGRERKVADLIYLNQYCWREDRVMHLFLHHEAEVILQTRLNPLGWKRIYYLFFPCT
ncbi:hypothetical protein M9H77_03478 [Catharanthus roseus]|uniref:Uncharacterized protein n=1 Tax=Catharanthus roseus TaxID=4058 RepID=A0ACC0CBE7_CATRO|nr:hypothetical protein M9H77_03478 [Catharanthus roseus]